MVRKGWIRALAALIAICLMLACCALAVEGGAAPVEASAAMEAAEATAAKGEAATEAVEPAGEVAKVESETATEAAAPTGELAEAVGEAAELAAEATAAEGETATEAVDQSGEVSEAEGETTELKGEPGVAVPEGADAIEAEAAVAEEVTAPAESDAAGTSEAADVPGGVAVEEAVADSPAEPAESCAHENATMDVLWRDATYTKKDGATHFVEGHAYSLYSCPDCDTYWEGPTSSEITRTEEAHLFEDGVCVGCEYKNPCTHPHVDSGDGFASAEYEPIDDRTHRVTGYAYTWYCCDTCNEWWEDEPDSKLSSTAEEHRYEEGVCINCKHKNPCTHPCVESGNSYASAEYTPIDAYKHEVSGYAYTWYCCDTCDEWWEDEPDSKITRVEEKHRFVDGVCESCKYENTCAHANTREEVYLEDAEYSDYDSKRHTATGTRTHYVYCEECGEALRVYEEEERVTQREIHTFTNDVCECGYVNPCKHPEEAQRTYNSVVGESYAYADETKHVHTGVTCTRVYCGICGEDISSEMGKETVSVDEEHCFDITNVCECGYVNPCKHSKDSVRVLDFFDKMYTDYSCVDAEKHAIFGMRIRDTYCELCGQLLSCEYEDLVSAEGAHEYEEGGKACIYCDYVRPDAPAPTPTMPAATDAPIPTPTMPAVTDAPVPTPTMPAATDAPAPTPTAAAAQENEEMAVNEDRQTIAETMIQVAETAASVEIVNAERILTPEEKAALDVLPVKEQLLTFLSVIGFEEQVNRTLEAAQEELSTNAIALKEQIQARIAAMDAEAYAAFEAALLESFPQEVIEIDGVEYTFFVLELEVRTGDTVRYERYGFRREGADWIFTRLEVAE